MEIRDKLNRILQDWKDEEIYANDAIDAILRLFGERKRYSISYLDEQDYEQNTEIWAENEDMARKELLRICPGAENMIIGGC